MGPCRDMGPSYKLTIFLKKLPGKGSSDNIIKIAFLNKMHCFVRRSTINYVLRPLELNGAENERFKRFPFRITN